ncbi:hypothetical protein N9Y92_02385 [Chlamydiales bacterium]|nr:hypothetical protein [Chlamydiales bacterium]
MFLFILLIFSPFVLFSSTPLIVKKEFISNGHGVRFKLPKGFYGKYIREDYQIVFPKEANLKEIPSSIVDIPLIMNVISMVWISGNQYTIEEMDEDLYYSLIKVKKFFNRYHQNTKWNGELIPKRLIKNRSTITSLKPAALFTGGVDSTATLLRHLDEEPHLISFGNPNKVAVNFATELSLKFQVIQSNYESFLNKRYLDHLTCDISVWRTDAIEGLSWVGMAAPLLYIQGIPRLYIASSGTWDEHLFPDGKCVRNISNPIVDENLTPFGLEVKHDAFDLTRCDKISYVLNYCRDNHLTQCKFSVCNKENCNHCEKCYRTINEIVALGVDPRGCGFNITIEKFIERYKFFLEHTNFSRRMEYNYHRNAQIKIAENLTSLPQKYLSYYKWFISQDLWEKFRDTSCQNSASPFSWEDYRDLYPDIPL